MKAVLFDVFGSAPRLADVPDPPPEPHGVVIRGSRLRDTSATLCPPRTSATTWASNSSSYCRRARRWGCFA